VHEFISNPDIIEKNKYIKKYKKPKKIHNGQLDKKKKNRVKSLKAHIKA
jgi:hypothetical protein